MKIKIEKTMTLKEKARRYDEAIARARKFKENSEQVFYEYSPKEGDTICDYIFPELQETEDESIKNDVIKLVNFYYGSSLACKHTVSKDKMVAWLEKQGKQELPQVYETVDGEMITYSEIDKPKFKIGDWICNNGNSYLIANIDLDKRRYLFEVGGYTNTFLNWESIENADKNYHLWTIEDAKEGDILVYGDKVQHHVTIYMIFKSRRDEISAYTYFHMFNYEFKFHNWCDCGQSAHPATLQQRNMLFKRIRETSSYEWDSDKKEFKTEEKVDNANKVEPKFHEGDWIIFNELILYIDEVVDGYYRTTSISGIPNSYDWDIDNLARFWTIQDAKNGDVLASKHNQPFIYNGIFDEDNVGAYCGIDMLGNDFLECTFSCNWSYKEGVKPATKEQQELLFSTMKDAGYEFDFEKKELKKFHIIDEGKDEMDYCFTKMMNGEKVSSTWSEDDEKQLNDIIDLLPNLTNRHNWLKSLKDRVQPQNTWKPSKEQIIALRWVLNNIPYNKYKEEISRLLDQIKTISYE